MDFFDRQEAARKSSKRLVVYFVIAVLGVAGSVGMIGSWVLGSLADRDNTYTIGSAPEYPWWNPEVFFTTAGVTLALILLGSLFKTISLGSGGSAVARSLGGHKINPDSADGHERVLLNVVEEMVNMIIAQRAYEINSKSIQTSDEMLSRVNQLKR